MIFSSSLGDYGGNNEKVYKPMNLTESFENIDKQIDKTVKQIGEILEKNYDVPKIYYYDNSFVEYEDKDFAWHIKIKLFRYIKKPIIKFYKTYPDNPYLHFHYYANKR